MKLVIDQNCFRSAELATHLSTPSNEAILTDMAVYEMLKGADPIFVARQSLDTLSKHPAQVVTTGATGDLMREELKSGVPTKDPVDLKLTASTQNLLRSVAKAAGGAPFPLDAATIQTKLATAKAQRQNHLLNKSVLVGGVDVLRKMLPRDLQKDIRAGKLTERVYEFVYLTGMTSLKSIAAGFPISADAVERLYLDYSLIARYLMVYTLSQVAWFETGGSESMTAEAVTNDLIDIDFVVLASYFDGVLSKEKRVNRLHERFTRFCERKFDA